MENDATESGRPLTPEEAAERLRALEQEAARLREALTSQAANEDVEAPQEPTSEPEPKTEEAAPKELTAEQIEKAEKLLQRYHLEFTRGNKEIASQILSEAAEIAPGSSVVLEVLGDDAMARRKNAEALEFYKRAKTADPKNASADRKHAELVFNTQARAATVASSEFEAVASSRSAAIFSVILPGLGHIVTGQIATGIGYLVVWLGCVIWTIAMPDGVRGLVSAITGSSNPPFNAMVLVPILGGVITWLIALTTINAHAKTLAKRIGTSSSPKPPVDLPY